MNHRIFIIFHGRFPSEKAASLFAAKSAEAFANEEREVILVVPRVLGRSTENPYDYYHVKHNFRIVYLPIVDISSKSRARGLRFWISLFSFSLSTFWYLKSYSNDDDIVYSNEILPLFFASFVSKNVFYEMHDFPESKLWMFGIFLRRMRSVMVHNRWKIERLREIFDFDKANMFHIPNAVDIDEFDIPVSRDEARHMLNIPLGGKMIVYTGHLYGWKGVDTLALAAQMLPSNYLVVFVGGTPEDIVAFSRKYSKDSRILIAGFSPHYDIPRWQKAADVLVIPNTAKEKISAYYTSPMKLFEYMASRRPIVASRITSIEEILDDTMAFLVEPDNPKALAEGIQAAVMNQRESEARAARAYSRVTEYTWKKRAIKILAALQ